jgi:hypothetical protein
MGNASKTVLPVVVAVMVHGAVAAAAQLPPGSITGNPTPGLEQPPMPVLADRISVTGCLARVGAPASDPNSYSEERFTLSDVKKADKAPAGAGRSAAATAPLATRYRLAGIDTLLAPFVGKRVELSGEIINPTTGTGPTLRVEFVQKLAATCQ